MQLTSTETNLFLLLFLAAIVHSFYLSFLLLIKARKERGLVWLGLVIISWTVMMLNYVLYIGDWMKDWPHMLGVVAPFLYLMGPAYYLFIRTSSDKNVKLQWGDSLHLIPFIYILIQWVPVYAWPLDAKLKVIDQTLQGYRPGFLQLLLGNAHLMLVLVYAFISWVRLGKERSLKNQTESRIKWLHRFTSFFIVFLLFDLGIQVSFWLFDWDGVIMELLLVLMMALVIHVLGYLVLARAELLPPFYTGKYSHSSLSRSAIAQHQKRILDYLDQQRPWMDAGFSLSDLSDALDIPRHQVSQVLSEGFRLSFYDLISRYRVELFKQRLLAGEADKFSIQGLAISCGFGSKSSFHRAFKKMTGCTPTQWVKSVSSH